MIRPLILLGIQLALAISITFENQILLVPLALLPVLLLNPWLFRTLLRWKLLLFLAIMVGGVPMLLGEKTATIMGIPYSPEYVRATMVMASRCVVILLALQLFTSTLSLEELARRVSRTRFRHFSEAFMLATELLPELRGTASQAYREYRLSLPGRNVIGHTLSWTAEFIARSLVHGENLVQRKLNGVAPDAAGATAPPNHSKEEEEEEAGLRDGSASWRAAPPNQSKEEEEAGDIVDATPRREGGAGPKTRRRKNTAGRRLTSFTPALAAGLVMAGTTPAKPGTVVAAAPTTPPPATHTVGTASAATCHRARTSGGATADTLGAAARDTLLVPPPYTLGEIVVLATRNAVTRSATVHEMDAGRIADLAIRSPKHALQKLPGVHFSGNVRGENSFQLRGFHQRQVSVFLDGVPVSLPFDGLVDVAQFVGTDLDRVRVSHGFSSLLHGANSLGGAVSLFTRPPATEPSVTARVEGSDHGRLFGSTVVSGGTEKVRMSGSFALERAESFTLPEAFAPTPNQPDNKRDNSAYQRRRAGLRAQYLPGDAHQIGLHLSITDNWFHVPPNTLSSRPRYWRFPLWRRSLVSVNTHHSPDPSIRLRTSWYHDRYRNLLRSFDDATYTTQQRGYAFDSQYRDHSYGVNLFPTLTVLPFGATDGAISFRRDVHRQSTDAEPLERYVTEMVTIALEQDVDLGTALSMMLGANMNRLRPASTPVHEAPAGSLTQLNAQWAIQYQHREALSSHLALSRKSRFPTMKELYSSRLGDHLANPLLRSESAVHLEAGFDLVTTGWRGNVTLFHSALRHLITEVVVDGGLRQMQNASRARMQGVELGAEAQVGGIASVAANYSYLHAANRSPDRDSRHLSYRPAHRFNGVASLRLHERLKVTGTANRTGSQYYQHPDTGNWERLKNITWIQLRSEYRPGGNVTIYASMDNVLDGAYSSQFGVPLPGRELSVGLRLDH